MIFTHTEIDFDWKALPLGRRLPPRMAISPAQQALGGVDDGLHQAHNRTQFSRVSHQATSAQEKGCFMRDSCKISFTLTALKLALVFTLAAVVSGAVLFPAVACAQTVTFSYSVSCNISDPNCPRSNLITATGVGGVASDHVSIATVNSNLAGYTQPVPISGGSLKWSSSPATWTECESTPGPPSCAAIYGNPGGSASVVGSVFGLPSGSTLLTASFQGGATSGVNGEGSANFKGQTNVSYINTAVLANLGMGDLPNQGTGVLSDDVVLDYEGNETITVLVTFTPANFTVLHSFTNGADGGQPTAGLTMDKAGNLYGTTFQGGEYGGGIAFKVAQKGSGWIFSPLYSFPGGNHGNDPFARVIIGSDGSLYGTTTYGGQGCGGNGCGTVFNLKPAAAACKTALCQWTETVLYRFMGGTDGAHPGYGDLVFDQAGNLYGTTLQGGSGLCNSYGCGTVYELTPAGSSWMESVLYSFTGQNDGRWPYAGVTLDKAGNLYGSVSAGGAYSFGTVYKLAPSGSDWTENTLYAFQDGSDGSTPIGGLIFDQAGNLYGTTSADGSGGGTVFTLAPSNGNWAFTLLYGFAGPGGGLQAGPQGNLLMDSAGNLYGTTYLGGVYGQGSVFMLTPSSGGWTYSDLYDFTGGNDGKWPNGSVVLDANGNLYGTTNGGGPSGSYGYGVVWELMPLISSGAKEGAASGRAVRTAVSAESLLH
jgi:uncharacterized repeat protein (TIGR03803 family)